MFSKSGAPMEADAHFRALLDISFGVPSTGALLQGPLHGILRREMPHSLRPPSFILQSPWYMSPPPDFRFPSAGKGPPWREMPVSGAYLNISSRVPSEEAPPPRPPPQSLFREKSSIPRASFIHLLKSPVDKLSSRFPKWGPYGNRCPSPEPFLPNLQGPQHGSLPSRFPSQSSHRERCPTFRAPFNHTSKSLEDEPTPGCPTEPT